MNNAEVKIYVVVIYELKFMYRTSVVKREKSRNMVLRTHTYTENGFALGLSRVCLGLIFKDPHTDSGGNSNRNGVFSDLHYYADIWIKRQKICWPED